MEGRRVRLDTHASFKKLVAAGIPRQQADAYVCLLLRCSECVTLQRRALPCSEDPDMSSPD